MSFNECASIENAVSGLCAFQKRNILLSNRRVYFHKVCIAAFDGITRDTVIVLKPANRDLLGYSYQLVNDDIFIEYATRHSYGSEQPVLSWESAKIYKVLKPKSEFDDVYSKYANSIIDCVIKNELEIANLTKQRDELLPLLMNGQVSVNYHLFFNLILPTIALHKKIFRHLSFVFSLFLYLLHKFIIMKEAGYVYILTNPSFKEDWVKIGKSSRPVDVRSKELDNTAVPLPFEIYATLKTVKYEQVEKLIHKTIDRLTDLRIRQNREFFNVSPAKALDILKDISTTLDDAEIDEVYLGEARFKKNIDGAEVAKKTRPRFKFSMVNIPIGATLTFVPTGINVKVADDDKIEYEGRLYKLSPFVGTFMPEDKRNMSGAYQGAKYFTYQGEILDDIRTRLEEV